MPKRIPATVLGLTVQQPYCWQLMEGRITKERRTGMIDYRGPIAIIAGARPNDLPTRIKQFFGDIKGLPDIDDLPFNAIVGVIDLVEVHRTEEPGMPFVWELRNPRRLKKPEPHKGAGHVLKIDSKLVRKLL